MKENKQVLNQTQVQTQTSDVAEVSSQPKPNNSLLLLMGALILILLASTGFLTFQNYQLRKEISQLESSPSPTPTPDPTANWKTYSNEAYKYSFKYPPLWKINTTSPQTTYLEIGSVNQSQTFARISISGTGENDKSIEELARAWRSGPIEKIQIGGQEAVKVLQNPNQEGEPLVKGAYSISIFVKNRSNINILIQLETANLNTYQIIFDQILSTFKFLEEKETAIPTPPAGWIPHESDEVGVTLYTPDDWGSDLKYYPSTNSNLIRFWKKLSPNIVPIQLDIKPDWSNTGDTQYYAKNYKVSGSIDAIRIDPPKKEEEVMERYQTNVFFEKSGKVYVFECVHNWTPDYLDTCNKMLETMVFE